MASTSPNEIALLRDLIARPSVSGTEAALGAWVETEARAFGLDVRRDERGVAVDVRGKRPGKTLALVSHLDTVPPGDGWTRDPFDPVIVDGRMIGRGAADAKASVAAMLAAAFDIAARGGPAAGRLVVLLGYGEETRDATLGALLAAAEPVDAAVVGEPTGLDLAIAQRGLLLVDLVARGEQRHAGNAEPDAAHRNAIRILAADLVRLEGLFAGRPHPVLGDPTATPTMLEAGVARNVTPPTARALLDIRSTPAWPHAELAAELRAALESEVKIVSDRLVPCETPAGSALLAAASRARPRARRYGSPTCSDWTFLAGRDVVKCGPGESRASHTPDEWVEVDQVSEARAFYAALAGEMLR